jgi:hypothetical protein
MILLLISLLNFSGNIGARSEFNITQNNNLPDAYASCYFNFRAMAGPVGLNLNGEFSQSEKRFSPQFIKRLGFSTDIGILHLDIGDHSPRYSKYTLTGTQLRGLSFRLTPGPFIFGMTGGRIRVGGADTLGVYRREVYSLLAGIKNKRFEFTTNIARLNDRSSKIDSIYTPQENIAAGVSLKIFLPMRIRIEGEGGYSIFTRDKETETLDTLRFNGINPSDFGFTPRISTRMDYGYSYSIFIPIKIMNFRYGKDYLGPGYTTLGNPYQKNDVEKDMFSTSINLFKGKFFNSFTYLIQSDNLSGEKAGTTQMDNFNYSTAIRPVDYITLRGRFSNLSMDKSDSLYHHNYTRYVYDISPEVKFKTGNIHNSLYLKLSFNNTEMDTTVTKGQGISSGYTGKMNNDFSFHLSMEVKDYGKETRRKFNIGCKKGIGESNSISANIGFGTRFESRLAGYFLIPGKINITPSVSYYHTTSDNLRFSLNIARSF